MALQDSRQRVGVLLVVVLLGSACGGSSVADSTGQGRRPVSYLDEVVPPCTPVDGSQEDPCQPGPVTGVEVRSVTGAVIPPEELRPDFTPMFVGTGRAGLEIIHIVVRGAARPGTTRCQIYPVTLANYLAPRPALDLRAYFYCFVDVTIHEYIVGTGPPELALMMHREIIWPIEDVADWPDVEDKWIRTLRDPQARTAAAYEGKELVLLLRPAISIAVEAMTPLGLFTRWFVQRDDAERPNSSTSGPRRKTVTRSSTPPSNTSTGSTTAGSTPGGGRTVVASSPSYTAPSSIYRFWR